MIHLFRLLSSLLIALAILSMLSFFMAKYQILDPQEQERLKLGKTFWKWNYSDHITPSIHYIEKGSGSSHIILIHGFRANTYTWRHLIDPLAQSGFHVWALDLVGYGYSDKPELEYKFDLFLQQISDFMKEKKIEKAHFVGGSMGGGICLGMAVFQPQKVESLTLISALGYEMDLPLSASIIKNLSFLWGPFLGPNMVRKGLQQLVYSKDSITDEQINAYCLPYYFPGGSSAALSTLKNFDNDKLKELSQKYQQIDHPLLLVWGKEDPLIPIEHFDNFCRDFPHAEIVLFQQCGHIPHEEKPEEVTSSILSFVQHIKPRKGL